MKTFKILTVSLLTLVLGFTLVSMVPQQQKKAEPWEVPAQFKNMKNPVATDDASVKKGMVNYNKFCASCHGKTGLGDGVKARALKTFPGDFSGSEYQNQTDGEHFYKTKFGRGEMPKYEGKVPDNDIWDMVNYMRTFKK
ncbi:MAG TPA: cytochrome c [Bacteroidales bacterium]|nr:cytochrome c [Bacteroidales bacterium]